MRLTPMQRPNIKISGYLHKNQDKVKSICLILLLLLISAPWEDTLR